MAGMKSQEILKLVNKYIGDEVGNLKEFSYRTLREFYPEYCGLEYEIDERKGTKRTQFVEIITNAQPRDQAKIIRGVLERIEPNPRVLPTRTEELYDELLALAGRLEGACPVGSPKPAITSEVVERAIADAERLLDTEGATSAVDRLHTALHGYLKAVCDDAGIVYTRETTMNGLFKMIREQHPAFADLGPRAQDITTVTRAMASIMDAMNPIRNMASVAHPNKDLLDTPEAALVVNTARTILHYLDMKLSAVTA